MLSWSAVPNMESNVLCASAEDNPLRAVVAEIKSTMSSECLR